MLEQIGNALNFYAYFTYSKIGKTGLTVTVDVYKVDVNLTSTKIISAVAATEIGGGLYGYKLASGNVTVEGEYIAIFKTASAYTDVREIPAIWTVGKAGVELLDAAISSRSVFDPDVDPIVFPGSVEVSGIDAATLEDVAEATWDYSVRSLTDIGAPVAADFWAYPTRTLTQPTLHFSRASSINAITLLRGDTLDLELSGLGEIIELDTDEIWFTVKASNTLSTGDDDSNAIIQITMSEGLVFINGEAAVDPTEGEITIVSEDGTLGIVLEEAVTAELDPSISMRYDIQILDTDGNVTTLAYGDFIVETDVTRTIEKAVPAP